MNGLVLTHKLREIDPNLKIIASSGLRKDVGGGLRGDELEAAGVDIFLAKPYTTERLILALHELLVKPVEKNDQVGQN
jgi:CheY-like chemotaxis protein